MNGLQSQLADRRSPGPRRLKEVVLHCFQASAGEAAEQLQKYSESDWPEILLWLDISGMALYLLDRLKSLELEDSVRYGIEALCREWRMPKVQQR